MMQADAPKMQKYRSAMEQLGRKRWEDEWETVVKPGLLRPSATRKAVYFVRILILLVLIWLLRFTLGFF
jgi:hypothetical protein